MSSEEDASMALQVSNALTQALLQFRMNNLPHGVSLKGPEYENPALQKNHSGGGAGEWFRAQDLKSGGPWFKSSTLPPSDLFLGRPEFNSSTALCK